MLKTVMPIAGKRKFVVQVVGCKVNQVEANMLAEQFEAQGWVRADGMKPPDLYIIHTCTVTQRADRDSRRLIIRAREKNPHAMIVVSGCLAELEPDYLSGLPGVIAVIPQARRGRAADIARQTLSSSSSRTVKGLRPNGQFDQLPKERPESNPNLFFRQPYKAKRSGRARAVIKVEDGCDGQCTYCRVRLARGQPVSRPLPDILKEAESLIESGFQEIVITGVNLGCWQPGLGHLISVMADLPGEFRLRISSLEPQHITPEFITAFAKAGDRVCQHLHLPVQSGDDGILSAMGRRYTVSELKQRIEQLKTVRPGLVLTGDVIVGFPGESDQAFENTCQLVKEGGLVRLHVFPFSARPGTLAAVLPGQLPSREITARAKKLRAQGAKQAEIHRKSLIGRDAAVLL
ncbi:tRNA (N(6)-L-threonylcarbamoyladenosine(37)-C(2))-methylthiotransferase MtaB, partial [bacterium]|nr:tRNA (N(6)-L-threonylcarbamoyladenosine(37)-C(2))-methylthiotransferase MtaB [bacterium]